MVQAGISSFLEGGVNTEQIYHALWVLDLVECVFVVSVVDFFFGRGTTNFVSLRVSGLVSLRISF